MSSTYPRPNCSRHVAPRRTSLPARTKIVASLRFHLRTIWLFTRSDLKTIVIPSTVFAAIESVAAWNFGVLKLNPIPRLPLVLIWTWINLLPFAIDNQRQPDSIEEDALNKPWRPLPSGRIQPRNATRLMFIVYGVTLLASIQLGAVTQCVGLMFFGWWYNDKKGADISPYVRNLINGFGYVCFTSGALKVAVHGEEETTLKKIAWWLTTIFLIVCTTVQSQDMYDQEGDAIRDRKTVPLAMGDGVARLTIAIPVLCWSWVCPWLWSSSTLCYLPVLLLGACIAFRTLTMRTVTADKTTFRIWNLWLTSIYCIPLAKSLKPF